MAVVIVVVVAFLYVPMGVMPILPKISVDAESTDSMRR